MAFPALLLGPCGMKGINLTPRGFSGCGVAALLKLELPPPCLVPGTCLGLSMALWYCHRTGWQPPGRCF